jgi:hypothetical protein
MTFVIAAIFVAWLCLTIGGHFSSIRVRFARFDIFCLIPQWNFFAPTPGRVDYHVLYRHRMSSGVFTPWTEVSHPTTPWWARAIWNPHRRARKALFDLLSELAIHLRAEDRSIALSIPYLTLLAAVNGINRQSRHRYVQFLLMKTEHDATVARNETVPTLVFCSDCHELA